MSFITDKIKNLREMLFKPTLESIGWSLALPILGLLSVLAGIGFLALFIIYSVLVTLPKILIHALTKQDVKPVIDDAASIGYFGLLSFAGGTIELIISPFAWISIPFFAIAAGFKAYMNKSKNNTNVKSSIETLSKSTNKNQCTNTTVNKTLGIRPSENTHNTQLLNTSEKTVSGNEQESSSTAIIANTRKSARCSL